MSNTDSKTIEVEAPTTVLHKAGYAAGVAWSWSCDNRVCEALRTQVTEVSTGFECGADAYKTMRRQEREMKMEAAKANKEAAATS